MISGQTVLGIRLRCFIIRTVPGSDEIAAAKAAGPPLAVIMSEAVWGIA